MELSLPPIIEFLNLTAECEREGVERAIGLRQVDLELGREEWLVLAGEYGSGPSLLARLAAGMLDPSVSLRSGELLHEGSDLLTASRRMRSELRRRSITFLSAGLDQEIEPDRTVAQWLVDAAFLLGRQRELRDPQARLELLAEVGIFEAETVLSHPMGSITNLMRRRLSLIPLILGPTRLLICEHVTAPLDRFGEWQFIALLRHLRSKYRFAILMAMERLSEVVVWADRVVVFYEGGVLEAGPASEIISQPRFEYTRSLMACQPRLENGRTTLPVPSREAIREAEEAVHRQSIGAVKVDQESPEATG